MWHSLFDPHGFTAPAASVLLLIAAMAIAVVCRDAPRPAQATVTEVKRGPSGTVAYVKARSSEGITGGRAVLVKELTCRVGDTIEVTVRRSSVVLPKQACVGPTRRL